MNDLIDRQAAIDALKRAEALTRAFGYHFVIDTIRELPSAQPEPKEGHWILRESPDGGEQYECSECGVLWEFNDGTPEDNEAYFCPNCGAKMVEYPESGEGENHDND